MKIDGIHIAIGGAIAEEIAEEKELLRNQLEEALAEKDDEPEKDDFDGEFDD